MTALAADPAPVIAPTVLTSVGVDVRRESDGSRYYYDPVRDRLYASVTTAISSCTSAPWLIDWAAKLAAETAVAELPTLTGMLAPRDDDTSTSLSDRRQGAVDYLKGIAKSRRETAADAGTLIHDIVEALVLDTALPIVPDELAASADAFLDWHTDFEPVYWMSEATVCHPLRGHAGTLDLAAYVPSLGKSYIIDCKSGAHLNLYMAAQLAAYRNSTEVWLPHGQRTPMPQVDACAVLHLRPEGYKFVEVDNADDEAYGVFLRMLEQLAWRDRQPKALGRVIYKPLPDGSQPPPLLEDIEGVPARSALAQAGITRLDHLAAAPAETLLDTDGFGPKSLVLVYALLLSHGLSTEHLRAALGELEAKAAAALERKRRKCAQAHEFVPAGDADYCLASGVDPELSCGLPALAHEPPKRAPRKRTAPAVK